MTVNENKPSVPVCEDRSTGMVTARRRRRGLLRIGMLSTAAGLAGLVLPNASPVGAQASDPEGVKIGEIYQLQAAFHQAKSHQDIDLMMSLWATDATFTFGGNLFSGADAIRSFFLGSGSWTHPRISLVPSFKDQIQVNGNQAYLYFKCHDVALTDESAEDPERHNSDPSHELWHDPQRQRQLGIPDHALRRGFANLDRHDLRRLASKAHGYRRRSHPLRPSPPCRVSLAGLFDQFRSRSVTTRPTQSLATEIVSELRQARVPPAGGLRLGSQTCRDRL